ncbi:hypothetical protein [Paludibacterium yongneupense]|uniref:hypothetical protein n=1 Tax=Paludibacterium yongneupense TaxID=400061 RepID=UPI0003FBCF3F|nr:hypothetical protein [Paludibacterium yongneupense]
MSCSLYAWLGDRSPVISNELLAFDLTCCLVGEEGDAVLVEPVLAAPGPRVAVRWGSWSVRIGYEEGAAVARDAACLSLPDGTDKRLHLECEHLDSAAQARKLQRLLAFLQEIYGAAVVEALPREVA